METLAKFAMHTQHNNWMIAQVMALPEEAQEKYMRERLQEGEVEPDSAVVEFIQRNTDYFTI